MSFSVIKYGEVLIYNDRFELKLKIGFKTINNVVDIILFLGRFQAEFKKNTFHKPNLLKLFSSYCSTLV